jgi:carbonyl reductase 1
LSDQSSIKRFASDVDGPIDVLINNAGVNLDNDFSLQNAQTTLDSNYRGTLAMCQAFLPSMRKGTSRIVNLSSTASGLSIYSSAIADRFRSSALGSLDDVHQLAQEYISSIEQGSLKKDGWPSGGKSYSVSKACVNAFTAILARDNKEVTINCCCPGWVDTDMGKQVGSSPSKTPEEGARIPVHLAFGDIGDVTGKYWGNDSISGRGVGKVQSW